jgi:hypothetical protein
MYKSILLYSFWITKKKPHLRGFFFSPYIANVVSSQNVGAHPCGRPVGRRKAMPLPRIIEQIPNVLQKLQVCSRVDVVRPFFK